MINEKVNNCYCCGGKESSHKIAMCFFVIILKGKIKKKVVPAEYS
jgi:hypothetical protein